METWEERRDKMNEKFNQFLQSIGKRIEPEKFLKILETLESAKEMEAITSREYKRIFDALFCNVPTSVLTELVSHEDFRKRSRAKAKRALLRHLKGEMRQWGSDGLLSLATSSVQEEELKQLAIEIMAESKAGHYLNAPSDEDLYKQAECEDEEIKKIARLAIKIIKQIKSHRKRLHLDPCWFSDAQKYPLSGYQRFPIKDK